MRCRFVVFVVALLLTLAAAGCNKQIKPGNPLRGLNREQQDRFQRGRAVFNNVFTPETGLGPLFNAVSCGECHEEPAAGGFGDEVEVHATALRADHVCDPLTGEGGPVIQQSVTPALKAALAIDSEPFPKGATGRGNRTTPVLFGRGLLESASQVVVLLAGSAAGCGSSPPAGNAWTCLANWSSPCRRWACPKTARSARSPRPRQEACLSPGPAR